MFALCGISRQAHYQAVHRLLHEQQKSTFYVRFMQHVREIHPKPDGISRNAFVVIGLQEGYSGTVSVNSEL